MKILFKKKLNIIQINNLAKNLANKSVLGDVYLLTGDLGAGKTTFSRFFINKIYEKNLLKKPNTIKSPSFPIMINYSIKDFEIFHYDFYRIKNKNDFKELNIFENINKNIFLVEWPKILNNFSELEKYFLINFEIINQDLREIEIKHTHIKNLNNDR